MRKQPRQRRSRQRVEALIDAAAEEIETRGLLETTTNHIAERADVSIGSLYQYFDDKDDLITALLRRLSAEIATATDATLAASMDADLRQVVRKLLNAALAAMDERPGLYLELTRNWHSLGALTVVESLETRLMDACRRYLMHHHRAFAVADLPAALFVVVNGTLFTVMRYLSLSNPGFERRELVDNLSAMIAGYASSTWTRQGELEQR